MYGNYDPPFSLEKEGISIAMKKIDAQWMYKRILGSDSVEKLILEEGKLVINPVK